MNKAGWIVGIVLIIVAVLGTVLIVRTGEHEAPAPAPETTGNATVGATGESSVIAYTDAGFSPAAITVPAGTTVTWSNESALQLAVVDATLSSDRCPATEEGDTLRQCEPVGQGGSYSHTFATPGTYTYANRERRSDTGTITVTEGAAPAGPINPAALPQ